MLAATPVDMSQVTPNYNCANKAAPGICYGIGSTTDALFRSIQTLVNYFAPVAGFAVIAIDGKIGAGTVNALQAAARQMLQVPAASPFGNNLMAFSATKEMIAQNAVAVQSTLKQGISTLGLHPVSAPTGTQVVPGTSMTPPLTLPPLATSGSKLKPWLIGGGILAVASIATYFVMTAD